MRPAAHPAAVSPSTSLLERLDSIHPPHPRRSNPHSPSRDTHVPLPRFPPLEVCVRRPPVHAAPPSWGRHPQTFTKAALRAIYETPRGSFPYGTGTNFNRANSCGVRTAKIGVAQARRVLECTRRTAKTRSGPLAGHRPLPLSFIVPSGLSSYTRACSISGRISKVALRPKSAF